MSANKRITGEFPVFGSNAEVGAITDLRDNILSAQNYPSFYSNNPLAYGKGFNELTTANVNGAFNFITESLKYLYQKGIPEHSLNVEYNKGDVVTYENVIYISLVDNNTTHVFNKAYWDKIVTEQSLKNTNTARDDGLPIGTILTVPVNTEREGYINYEVGQTFNSMIYPKLEEALGTTIFVAPYSTTNSELPIGSIMFLLSKDTPVPYGWVEWNSSYGSLREYPELMRELEKITNGLPEGEIKTAWLKALTNECFPSFEHSNFYFSFDSNRKVGEYKTDTTKQATLVSAPVVIDSSNLMTPMGYTRISVEPNTYPSVVNTNTEHTKGTDSNYLLVGHAAEVYREIDLEKKTYITHVGDGNETAPKTLFTRVIVKAKPQIKSGISSTHKQIIKAFVVGE